MKKNIVLLVFSVFLIISCRKEGKIQEVTFNSTEYNDEPSDKVYKEQIAVSDFANSDLLIVTIPFYNNMFHFPNIESFYAVKEEIHQKRDEYQDYFIWRDLNFSSFDKVSKVESLFN
ncbi:MAG TPA: hypothetical protein ENI82_00040, partial [Bacteroidetes bacterium]|nr:hypothetical protein [Bacteroidota bacterium]